jgi:hypothetical protein
MGKPLGEMTPAERRAAIRRAVMRFQNELNRSVAAIEAVLNDEAEAEHAAQPRGGEPDGA